MYVLQHFVARIFAMDDEDDVCWSLNQYIKLSLDMYLLLTRTAANRGNIYWSL